MTTPRGIAVILLALLGMLLAGATTGEAQQSPDPRVADIVKAGKLRVGFGLGGINSTFKDARRETTDFTVFTDGTGESSYG